MTEGGIEMVDVVNITSDKFSTQQISSNMDNENPDINQVRSELDTFELLPIDLDNVMNHLANKLTWSNNLLNSVCIEYKKFLFLHKLYPEYNIIPGQLIDEVWHNHILQSKQYFEDCNKLFGAYFYHEPAIFGSSCDKRLTLELYRMVYGYSAPAEIWSHSMTECISGNVI